MRYVENMVTLTQPGQEITVTCPHCTDAASVRRFGTHRGGNPRYHCKTCNRTFCLNPGTTEHPPQFREMVLRAYQERSSMRGISRTFGISRSTLYAWLGEKSPRRNAALRHAASRPKGRGAGV